MRRSLCLPLVAAVAVVFCAHCSSTPAVVAAGTPAAACARYYAALTAWSERCAQGAPTTFRVPANVVDACAAQAVAPGVAYTPQRLAACAAATERATCQPRDAEVLDCLPGAGTLADGVACGIDAQCKSAACIVDAGKACGVCKPRVAKDERCGATIAQCTDGLTCFERVCVPAQSPAGSRCTIYGDGPQCAAGLQCLPTAVPVGQCGTAPALGQPCESTCAAGASCESSVCVAALPAGAACIPAPKCTAGKCAGGSVCAGALVCDELTKRCQPVVVQRVGGACNYSSAPCQDGTDCAEYDGTKLGECRSLPGLGLACDAPGVPCQTGLRCVEGKCTTPAPATCR
jgi:hypothetical protein